MHSSNTVIYIGVSWAIWGHVITDDIRRVWFLQSEYFNQFKTCPLVYIGQDIKQQWNFCRLLELLEVDVDKLQRIEQPTQFDKIILPDESFFYDGFNAGARKFTDEYCETIEHIRNFALKNQTPTACKKVYYFHGRKGFGEEQLAEYFKSKGYEVLRPETLTLDEQLNWLINAESFASTVGSISHNTLFLREGTETILILRCALPVELSLLHYQITIDQILQTNLHYVDSSLSIWHKPFCYIISEQLKRFFGDKWNGYEDDDFKAFLQYVKDCTGKGLAINQQAKKYYAPVLEDFMTQLKRREDLITAYNMPPRWETFQPTFGYRTHVSGKGWSAWNKENQVSNDIEQKRQIEAIKINVPRHKVYYSVYYNDKEGWSEEVSNGEQAGTTGKSKSIYGVRIRLDEAGDKEFDVLYRVHTFDDTWTAWAKNGEAIYSHGVKLNALQIKSEPKGK